MDAGIEVRSQPSTSVFFLMSLQKKIQEISFEDVEMVCLKFLQVKCEYFCSDLYTWKGCPNLSYQLP